MDYVLAQVFFGLPSSAFGACPLRTSMVARPRLEASSKSAAHSKEGRDVVVVSSPTPNPVSHLNIPPISSLVLEDMPPSPQMKQHRKRFLSCDGGKSGFDNPSKCLMGQFSAHSVDDHTLETVNTDEEEEDSSSSSDVCCGGGTMVSFAEPLVTEVWYRPYVKTIEEKRELFYCDTDYQRFRREFVWKQQRLYWKRQDKLVQQLEQEKQQREQQQQQLEGRQEQMVSFPQNQVVTHVFEYPHATTVEEKSLMFYSERDLERFLDDFVTSLNGVMGVEQQQDS